ncbi:hypothetical protein ACJIZ3_014763 [Penstemon smallii]|uniref:Uncharacterized protein n=1 Tax=Penstemon smallii TaxID=265156 RepID=A0ABD3RUJ4_9LAMI
MSLLKADDIAKAILLMSEQMGLYLHIWSFYVNSNCTFGFNDDFLFVYINALFPAFHQIFRILYHKRIIIIKVLRSLK